MRILICSVLSGIVLFTWQVVWAEQGLGIPNLSKVKTRDALANQLHQYSTSKVEMAVFDYWLRQLDNNERFSTDANWSSKLKVRDVAVVCLEAMAGREFFPAIGSTKRHEVLHIISHATSEEVFRYSLTLYDEEEVGRIRFAIDCWRDGYEKGQQKA